MITIILAIQYDLRMMRMVDFIQHKLAKCTQARDAWAVGNSETFRRARSRWERWCEMGTQVCDLNIIVILPMA